VNESEGHNYTERLGSFVAELSFKCIPRTTVEVVKMIVLDALGCGLLGCGLPWSARLRETLAKIEAPGDATVWGSELTFSAPTAALLNAVAVHGFELDDIGIGGHNGSVVLPTALALADHLGKMTGAELVCAVTAGIEVSARVALCVGGIPAGIVHTGMGFHGPALMGTFAAAATAAKSLSLSRAGVVDALGHAGQQTAGLMFVHHGGAGKRLLAGQGARSGTLSGLLAAGGFASSNDVFDAEFGGFCSAHTGNQRPPAYDLDELLKGLGETWYADDTTFKMWACRGPCHGALEAIKTLRRDHDFRADDVATVRIRLGRTTFQNVGWPYRPSSVTSAQLNLQYVVAVMLREHDVFIGQFSVTKIADPQILALISRVDVQFDPEVDDIRDGTTVEIEFANGRVISAVGRRRNGVGKGNDPVGFADVVDKFRRATASLLDAAAQQSVIEAVGRLESLPDVRELVPRPSARFTAAAARLGADVGD
jgi:aconitate decarboxylase